MSLGASPLALPYGTDRTQPKTAGVSLPPGALARYSGLSAPVWPGDTDSDKLRISGAYVQPRGSTIHFGLDLSLPLGTPLRAMAPGRVTGLTHGDWPKPYGLCRPGHRDYSASGCAAAKALIKARGMDLAKCGNRVRIEFDPSPDGSVYTATYCHLSQILVKDGARLERGQVVGAVGHTGSSTAPHLHVTLYRDQTPGKIDPTPFIAWGNWTVYYKNRSEQPPAGQVFVAAPAGQPSLPTIERPLVSYLHTAGPSPAPSSPLGWVAVVGMVGMSVMLWRNRPVFQ